MTSNNAATTVAPDELARVAATAAGAVEGVHALGSNIERAADAVRERVGLAGAVPGVRVDSASTGASTVDGQRAAVTVSIVVDYPHPLRSVADTVRDAVRDALAPHTGQPAEVTVVVSGVWGPFDREPQPEEETSAVDPTPVERDDDLGSQAALDERPDAEQVIADALEDAASDIQEAADVVRDESSTRRP